MATSGTRNDLYLRSCESLFVSGDAYRVLQLLRAQLAHQECVAKLSLLMRSREAL